MKENNIIGFQNLIQRKRCIFRKRNWQISELENNINNILLHAYLSDKTRNWLKEASNAVNPFKAHKESEAIGLSIKLLKWKIVNQKFMVNWYMFVGSHNDTDNNYSFLQGWNPPLPSLLFWRNPSPSFCVPLPPLSNFLSKLKKSPPSFWEPFKLVHVNCIKHFKMKVENIIIITLYTFSINSVYITLNTFSINSVYTTDTCFGYILSLMFSMVDMKEERTWNISNNYVIKSDVYIKLKLIRIYLDTYQHISYQAGSKKERNEHINYQNTRNAKQGAVSNLCQSLIFKPNFPKWYNNTQTVICPWKLKNYKLISSIFTYNQN